MLYLEWCTEEQLLQMAKSGDGSGLLLSMPHKFMRKKAQERGVVLPKQYAVVWYLPKMRKNIEVGEEVSSKWPKNCSWVEMSPIRYRCTWRVCTRVLFQLINRYLLCQNQLCPFLDLMQWYIYLEKRLSIGLRRRLQGPFHNYSIPNFSNIPGYISPNKRGPPFNWAQTFNLRKISYKRGPLKGFEGFLREYPHWG